MSIIKSCEHVTSLMTGYDLLQTHFTTEEKRWEIISDSKSKERDKSKGKKTKWISILVLSIQTNQIKVIVEEMENNLGRNKQRITLRRQENQKIVQGTEGWGQQNTSQEIILLNVLQMEYFHAIIFEYFSMEGFNKVAAVHKDDQVRFLSNVHFDIFLIENRFIRLQTFSCDWKQTRH